MLREKNMEYYSHILNDLIKSRARYIELSYNEKKDLIFMNSTKQD